MSVCSNPRLVVIWAIGFLLFCAPETYPSDFYWDGGTSSLVTPGNGASEGGAGNWSISIANWDNGIGYNAWQSNGLDNNAIFAGSAGTVTLTSPITANDLTFKSSGYSLLGTTTNRLTLNGSAPTIHVDAGVSASMNVIIAGSSGLTKSGPGTLSLTNTASLAALNNSYTGGTVVNAGTLAVVADGNFGGVPSSAGTNITLNGGTLQINTGFSSNANRQISLGLDNAAIYMNSTADFKPLGLITGSGTLSVTGSGQTGIYMPMAANSYAGDTHLGAGVISVPGISSTGSAGAPASGAYGRGILFLNGAKMRSNSTAYTIGNAVQMTTDTTFVAGGSSTLTFSGPVLLTNNRTITAQNTGNIIFSGQIGDGGGAYSFSLGASSLTDSTIVLAGSNTFSGATIIEGGTIRIAGASGNISNTNRLVIASGIVLNGDATAATNANKLDRINPVLTLELGGGAGGTFTMLGGGNAATAHRQSFQGVNIGRGVNTLNSSLTTASVGANFTLTSTADNYLRSIGGVLNITTATGFLPSFASLPSGSGIQGGVFVGAIRNGTDFIDANSLVFAEPAYVNNAWSSGTPTTLTTSNAVPYSGSTGSLRFNNNATATLSLDAGTSIIQSGNILVTANVGAANPTAITGGNLTSGNGTDLIIVQNNGAAITNNATAFPSAMTISSVLTNNAATAIGFTKAGTGVVVLSGSSANTFSGVTTVLGSGSTSNYAPLILSKPAGTNAVSGNLSIGSTGFAAVYLAASEQIADQSIVEFKGTAGSAFLQLHGFDETIAGLNDTSAAGVVEVEEQQGINSNSTLTLLGSDSYSFNGMLRNRGGGTGTGVLNLVINGTGTHTLSGAGISYTGTTTIQNGQLALVGASGFASSVTLGLGNATLQLSGNINVSGLATSAGAVNANALVQNAPGISSILSVNQSGDSTFSGILRDNPDQSIPSLLGFTKSGSGTLSLLNTNFTSGPIAITGGSIAIGSDHALGTGTLAFNSTSGSIRSLDSSTRTLGNSLTISTNFIFGSSTTGNLTFTGQANVGSASKSLSIQNTQTEFSGVISSTGVGALTKLGAGTLVWSGANTYTGATTVTEGILTLSGNRTANAAAITVGNTAANATLNITNGDFLVTGDFSVGVSNASSSAVVNQTGGTVTLASTANQLLLGRTAGTNAGQYNLSGGTLVGQASTSNGIILGSNDKNTGIFNLSGTGIVSMANAMLQIGRSEAAADGTTGIFSQTSGIANFGTLSIGGAGGGNNDDTTGVLHISGGTFTAANFTSMAGGNTSSATITIAGTATVTLPAFPTLLGTGSTATVIFDGGTLSPYAASAAYMGGLTNALLTANGAKFNIELGKDITITQPLSDAPSQLGTLTKLGPGDLTLAGNSTYTGRTTITGGRLIVSGALTSSIDIQATGTLSGSGMITGNITGAGIVAPGNSIGTLTVVGDYHVVGTHFLEISKDQINGSSSDQIILLGSGILNYDGNLKISIPADELNNLTIGDTWDLFDFTGMPLGQFDNHFLFGTPGDGFYLPKLENGMGWNFDYDQGKLRIGNVIPEPSAIFYSLIGSIFFSSIVILRKKSTGDSKIRRIGNEL